jgi:mRNA-degrading endonuclease RelE of RelBE toxin-antitoxin system
LKYTVALSRQAERFYKKLEKEAKAQVRGCLLVLEDDAYSGKRLHGDLKEYWSLRAGKTRIVYSVQEKEKTICVVAIGPRKTIYR